MIGTRIDYILASKGLEPYFIYADIQPEIMGSDHCPVYADFLPFTVNESRQEGNMSSPLLTVNFPEFKQNKLFSYFSKSVTPTHKEEEVPLKRKPSSNEVPNTNKKSRITMEDYFISNSTKTKNHQQENNNNKEESKNQWSLLFQAPKIPHCKIHDTPCLERTVTKKGPNLGRKFYICAKPVGPKDGLQQDYSCNFFQWKK